MAKCHYLPPTSTYLLGYKILPPPTNEPRGAMDIGGNVPAAPKFGENLHIFFYKAKYADNYVRFFKTRPRSVHNQLSGSRIRQYHH